MAISVSAAWSAAMMTIPAAIAMEDLFRELHERGAPSRFKIPW
jgi:hypothetical protein